MGRRIAIGCDESGIVGVRPERRDALTTTPSTQYDRRSRYAVPAGAHRKERRPRSGEDAGSRSRGAFRSARTGSVPATSVVPQYSCASSAAQRPALPIDVALLRPDHAGVSPSPPTASPPGRRRAPGPPSSRASPDGVLMRSSRSTTISAGSARGVPMSTSSSDAAGAVARAQWQQLEDPLRHPRRHEHSRQHRRGKRRRPA